MPENTPAAASSILLRQPQMTDNTQNVQYNMGGTKLDKPKNDSDL